MEERIIELLTRKFANEASEKELQELNELIAHNPDAAITEEVFREIWNSNAQEEDVDFFYKRHKKKYRDELNVIDENETIEEFKPADKRRKYFIAGLCAVFLIIIATTAFFYLDQKQAFSPAFTSIISAKGIRKSIVLPDGTSVWLNADSKLSYDANMNTNKERLVMLTGEAFFDVIHIKDRPFIIHTNKVSVKVLGTAFDVKAYPNDKKCETTLIRGSVEVSANGREKQKFILKPAEKFTLVEASGKGTGHDGDDSATVLIENISPVKVANKAYVRETSWTENKLIFENESLRELAPKLERWFDVKINIAGKIPGSYRFTGSFTNETIAQALTAMKLIKPFNFSIHDKNVTIY